MGAMGNEGCQYIVSARWGRERQVDAGGKTARVGEAPGARDMTAAARPMLEGKGVKMGRLGVGLGLMELLEQRASIGSAKCGSGPQSDAGGGTGLKQNRWGFEVWLVD